MATTRLTAAENPMPLYRRIHDDLLVKIESGEYGPGDRLPSELELARTYHVSRITSRQALDLLGAEGLLVRRQGMGSFVAPPQVNQPLVRLTDFVEDMTNAGLRPASSVLRFEEEPAPADVASLLKVEPSSPVFRLDRLRLANESPVALDWTWLPPQFGKLLKGEDLEGRTIYSILEEDYATPVASGVYTIEACRARKPEAELLGVAAGAALLLIGRTSFTADGRAVYHQQRYYRSDRVRYRLTLTRATAGKAAIESFAPVFSTVSPLTDS